MIFHKDRKTKIIATLGPASATQDVLIEMIKSGTDLIRLNASHQSDPKIIKKHVQLIRETATKADKAVGIFLDLQGPKIRVGKVKNDKIEVKVNQKIKITSETLLGTSELLSVSYPSFLQDIQVGDTIFIDDGRVCLKVLSKDAHYADCMVIREGFISNHKGINLPQTKISMSALTEKDLQDVKLAVVNKLDYIALSFVSTADDILELRERLRDLGAPHIHIIAKIERQLAVDNIISIIEVSDAIMVARGDLGVEIGIENVPKVQKMIIRESNKRLKPVIVATQMLESMILAETATRAEVSDVANAIYDRCDAVMLSGETAVGINPITVIKTMASICIATDTHLGDIKMDHQSVKHSFIQHSVATSFCKAADVIAQENSAQIIMAFTSSGNTPLIASKLNPSIPIIAPTDQKDICHKMTLFRGVTPILLIKKYEDIHRWTDMIALAIKMAKAQHLVKSGDTVVVTAGIPIGQSNGINSIRIVTVH